MVEAVFTIVPATREEVSRLRTISAVWARVTPENCTCTVSPVMEIESIAAPADTWSSMASTSMRGMVSRSSSVHRLRSISYPKVPDMAVTPRVSMGVILPFSSLGTAETCTPTVQTG